MVTKKRKSPYEHQVKSHVRAGTQVHDYVRGEGNAPISQPINHHSSTSDFTVIINYLDETATETLHVPAVSSPEAIQQAMSNRINVSTPTVVEAYRL